MNAIVYMISATGMILTQRWEMTDVPAPIAMSFSA
jgi:hypothetical protein